MDPPLMTVYKTMLNDSQITEAKANTVESLRSHVKMDIMTKTAGRIDISKQGTFQRLQFFMKGLKKDIKKQGRGDTKHYPPQSVPNFFRLSIISLLMWSQLSTIVMNQAVKAT